MSAVMRWRAVSEGTTTGITLDMKLQQHIHHCVFRAVPEGCAESRQAQPLWEGPKELKLRKNHAWVQTSVLTLFLRITQKTGRNWAYPFAHIEHIMMVTHTELTKDFILYELKIHDSLIVEFSYIEYALLLGRRKETPKIELYRKLPPSAYFSPPKRQTE